MKLKEFRNSKGITQKELGDTLQINQQTVARWENGKTEPSLQQLRDLAMVFGTSVDAILGREKPKSNVQRAFHDTKENLHEDYFYGYIGFSLKDEVITRWYPIGEKVANRFYNLDVSYGKDIGWACFETYNNRYVGVNLKNISCVTLNDDDDDEPYGDWEITYKEDMLPEEMYRAFSDNLYSRSDNSLSEKLLNVMKDYMKKNNLGEDDISELIHDSYLFSNSKLLFNHPIFIDKKYLPELFWNLEDDSFDDTEFIKIGNGNGSDYFLKKSNLSIVDSPRLNTLDSMDEELNKMEKNR